jgi:hypothetical protein
MLSGSGLGLAILVATITAAAFAILVALRATQTIKSITSGRASLEEPRRA